MSEIRLFIARHGETEYNRRGLMQGRGINAPLNVTGKKQAQNLADYLGNYQSDFLASSSLTRASETAGYFQEKSGLDLVKSADLDEMDFGDFEGKSYDLILNELTEVDESWRNGDVSLKIPGGESPVEVFERANNKIHSMMKNLDKSTMILVVHGRLIRILLSEWLGYGLKNMHLIDHENGAVNQFMFKDGMFKPVYLNKTDHLMNL